MGLTDLPLEALDPMDPIASRGVSVLLCLRNHIATCYFPGGQDPLSSPNDPTSRLDRQYVRLHLDTNFITL